VRIASVDAYRGLVMLLMRMGTTLAVEANNPCATSLAPTNVNAVLPCRNQRMK
jgi:hypothetical protein